MAPAPAPTVPLAQAMQLSQPAQPTQAVEPLPLETESSVASGAPSDAGSIWEEPPTDSEPTRES